MRVSRVLERSLGFKKCRHGRLVVMFPLNSFGILVQKPLQEPSQSISCTHSVEAVAAQWGPRGCKRKRDGDNKNAAIGGPFTIEVVACSLFYDTRS